MSPQTPERRRGGMKTPPVPSGLSVDRNGEPAIDPTTNVRALTEAANRRQDDLRDAYDQRVAAELRHVEMIAELRSSHSREMRELEAKRLDAIRAVDQLAVNTASQQALAAIQTLAATTTTTADVLRNALTNTAQTIATQTANTVSAITERIAALEKLSYTGIGKQEFADPMLTQMLAEIRSLRERRDQDTGKSQGVSTTWGLTVGAIGLILVLLNIYQSLSRAPAGSASPQIIYSPAPPGALLPTTPPAAVPR